MTSSDQTTVEDVLFDWLYRTDEGHMEVPLEQYRRAEIALGIIPCERCGGCGGCGECQACDAREESFGADPCPECHSFGIKNPERWQELLARREASA